MDVAESETFKSFTVLNKALLFLIKLNKTAVQSVPNLKIAFLFSSGFQISSKEVFPGSIVQTTRLDVQELEMAELKRDLRHNEKELAKYKLKDEKQM